MEEEAGWDGDPDAKINTETGSDKGGKLGSWFLLQESQLFLARQHELRNAAACVAWRMGPLRANGLTQPAECYGGCIPSACNGQTPKGPSAIFLLHKRRPSGRQTGEDGLLSEERCTPSLHDNHTPLVVP